MKEKIERLREELNAIGDLSMPANMRLVSVSEKWAQDAMSLPSIMGGGIMMVDYLHPKRANDSYGTYYYALLPVDYPAGKSEQSEDFATVALLLRDKAQRNLELAESDDNALFLPAVEGCLHWLHKFEVASV